MELTAALEKIKIDKPSPLPEGKVKFGKNPGWLGKIVEKKNVVTELIQTI